jgi:ABC-2 type transport system permease protein
MSKMWLIARYQFRQEVNRRSFFLVLFSMPLFLTFSIGLGYLVSCLEQKSTTLGYVDQAGLLVEISAESEEYDVWLVAFDTPEAARAALEAEEIDAYYVLAADYAGTHQAELVYFEPPHRHAMRHFQNAVRLNLMADQSPVVVDRALSGANLTVRATESKREFPAGGPSAGQLVPLIAAAIFAFLVLTTSGYMMQVVVEEKENRTIEIVVSSVSPSQMMTGKITGALGIALMQLAVWLAFLAGAVWLGGSVLEVDWLQNVNPNWRDILMIVVVALPSYLCIAAHMTTVGTTLVESQEAQQAGPLFFMLLFVPMYLLVPITENPNGPLSLGLSFFPVTSVLTIAIRSVFAEISVWQIALSTAIALVSGIVMVWLAGKAFRMSMLRYGQRLKWRELLTRRRSAPEPTCPASPGGEWR